MGERETEQAVVFSQCKIFPTGKNSARCSVLGRQGTICSVYHMAISPFHEMIGVIFTRRKRAVSLFYLELGAQRKVNAAAILFGQTVGEVHGAQDGIGANNGGDGVA